MSERPNILFILSDDQGAWAMRCAGNSDVYTPNIDRLAAAGVRFTNFFCASPVCSPARASIITGEMPSCHGVHDWLCAGHADTASHPYMAGHEHFAKADKPVDYLAGRPSYVSLLAQSGYRCALSGKWHLGAMEEPKAGFEKWFTLLSGGCRYYHADTYENGRFCYERRYITDVITDKALCYLDELIGGDAPFYLSVHYTAPHGPWNAQNHPEEYLKLYDGCDFGATPVEPPNPRQIDSCTPGNNPLSRKENLTGYYAAISAMDYNIGRLLDRLEQSGTFENTVVIFTSDNGMNMGHHGLWGKGNATYPPNLYDTSVKVPFIVSAPFFKNAVVSEACAGHCDIFPTLMELAGIEYKPTGYQTGASLLPVLLGGQKENLSPEVYGEYGFVRMLRTPAHKLVKHYGGAPDELYYPDADKHERNNMAQREHELASSLEKRLEEWFAKYSTAENDGRKYPVTGKGQRELCTQADSFVQEYKFINLED